MNSSTKQPGFTLIELMSVVAIIGILGAVAAISYQQYTMRARATDILVKYDAIRTGVNAQLAQGQVSQTKSNDCATLTNGMGTSNLADEYATLAYGFQAVTGGYRPVLTVCAKVDASGNRNVQVTRAAYETIAKSGNVEKGAVVTDAVVSFALPLTSGDEPLCKNAPVTAGNPCAPQTPPVPAQPKSQADCAPHQAYFASTCANVCNPGFFYTPTGCSDTPPQSGQSQSAVRATTQPQANAMPRCTTSLPQQVERKVITFGSALTGHVMNNGDLNTGGDLREFTAEVAIVGGTQVTATAGHGATILSYATRTQINQFLIWNPSSLTIEFNNHDYDSHVNVNDGQNHRLTVTWQSTSGALVLYDNGKEVWRATVNQGGVMGGNGKLVLGQDQDSYGGGFATNDAFQGKIISASLASATATGAQVGSGPIQTVFDANNGLITNVVLDANGKSIDTTQRHSYMTGGAITATTEKVDTGLYVTANCN